jgi:hypothetical protein
MTTVEGRPALDDRPSEPAPPPASGQLDAEWSPAADHPRHKWPLGRPGWERLSFAGLILGTAALYLIGLSKSGWANQFYAAAVQSGSKSWTAMLFGSLDAGNFITVDKPPAALWIMDVSARIFGVNSWSILVPQALEGVAAVAILHAAVKRVSTHAAGLLAGAVLATTPVAALMFRFDNPDALLVLLMTAAGYATVRAVEKASWRWFVLVGTLLGFAFLTKMLQGLLVVPAFGAAYLVAAPTGIRTRIRHTALAFAALIAAAGWWIALVELWPSASRPYIGGTNTNSMLELTFGYNGFGRLTGSSNKRQRRRRVRWVLLDRDRLDPTVRLRDGHADQLAAAGRADRDRRAGLADLGPAADGRGAGQRHRLGRLAARHRRRAQFRQRHHPPVLHGGTGAGDRRVRRSRGRPAVARTVQRRRPLVARGRRRRRLVVDVRPARTGVLAPRGALGRAGGRSSRGGRGDAATGSGPTYQPDRRTRYRAGVTGRTGCLCRADCVDSSHGGDPVRRPVRRPVLRRRLRRRRWPRRLRRRSGRSGRDDGWLRRHAAHAEQRHGGHRYPADRRKRRRNGRPRRSDHSQFSVEVHTERRRGQLHLGGRDHGATTRRPRSNWAPAIP